MNSYCSLHDISDLWAGVTMLVIAGVVAWVTKRVIDIVTSSIGLAATLPLYPLIAVDDYAHFELTCLIEWHCGAAGFVVTTEDG